MEHQFEADKHPVLRRHQHACRYINRKHVLLSIALLLALSIIPIALSRVISMPSEYLSNKRRLSISSHRDEGRNSSCTSLKPRTKYTVHFLDKYPNIAQYASQNITSAVKFATCRRLCDSPAEWELLPLFQPVDVVRSSTIKEVEDDHDYLQSLRLKHGWNTTAWSAHDRRQSECNFVCEIPHAFVDEIGHVCAVNDGVCFIQQDCMARAPDLPSDVSKLARYDKVLVISQEWGIAVYHGILESAIKLGDVLGMLQADESIHVHVPGNTDRVSILFPPILADLGIKPSRLVSGPLIGNMLIFPRATPCMNPSTRQLLKFRQVIENTDCYRKYSRSTMNATSILLVRRKPGTTRSFVNHEELKHALGKFAETRSFVLHEFSSPGSPFEGPPRDKCGIIQDMLRFKQSKVIVASHGAGLTNVLLCDPGTIIVETHTAGVNHVYTSISMRLGLRHLSLFDVKSSHSTPMTANVSAIINTLTALM